MKKFKCKMCTGCCHGPISLTYKEAIDLFQGQFPLSIIFVTTDVRNIPIENDKDKYSIEMKNFTKQNIGFYHKTHNNRKISVIPQIITLLPIDAGCHFLSNNVCTIYDNKPKVCSLYPFRIDTPITCFEEGLQREKNYAFEGASFIPCKGWDEDSYLIFKSEPTDKRIITTFKARMKESQETRKILKEFFNYIKDLDKNDELIEHYSSLNNAKNKFLSFNFSFFVNWLYENSYLNSQQTQKILKDQLEILQFFNKRIGVREDKTATLIIKKYKKYIDETLKIMSKINYL